MDDRSLAIQCPVTLEGSEPHSFARDQREERESFSSVVDLLSRMTLRILEATSRCRNAEFVGSTELPERVRGRSHSRRGSVLATKMHRTDHLERWGLSPYH